MLTFSKLGKKGNLGNQLFQLASTLSLAKRYNQDCVFPYWEYEEYFESNLPHGNCPDCIQVNEEFYHYHDWNVSKGNYDLYGYLQSEKYFDQNLVRNTFNFKKEFLKDIREKTGFTYNDNNILISVRRGDFVHHPWFYQLSYKYYFTALTENFPDWRNRKLIFTSDNIAYCKKHFSFLPNSYFLENLSAIEQLAFGIFCKDFIISNSTFSWWLAWLGEKKDSKIVVPIKNFRGKHAEETDESDYFPERWSKFDHHRASISKRFLSLTIRGEIQSFKTFSRYLMQKLKEKSLKRIRKIKT
ncbi:alpha-1,2-fucosyltransferase [Christiangramia sp. ASW11-125]|uniref:alpha-1,2-fucosyltransferase n=1 Tax=Christiangramia sp. ASW11-125 TaxID=3400701 RepID=UPI003AAADD3E